MARPIRFAMLPVCAAVFATTRGVAGHPLAVALVPGVNHIGPTLNALAVRTIARACEG
jgi:hypothetical protein